MTRKSDVRLLGALTLKAGHVVHLRHPDGCVPALVEHGCEAVILIPRDGYAERLPVSLFEKVIHDPAGCERPAVVLIVRNPRLFQAFGPVPYYWARADAS